MIKNKDYNTSRCRMRIPEYGRIVQQMVEHVLTIADRQKRTEQAAAIIRVMEILNPQVHQQEDYERKLWDHLHIISDFELDVDGPYPAPLRSEVEEKPQPLSINKKPVKARHYGRNIEGMIDLIAQQEEGETKTWLILQIADYMRRQYLIWNKDSVADETIFKDIETISDGAVKVPEGLKLSQLSPDVSFQRPNIGVQSRQGGRAQRRKMRKRNN